MREREKECYGRWSRRAESGERTVWLQMLRLEMGGTKGGAGALEGADSYYPDSSL